MDLSRDERIQRLHDLIQKEQDPDQLSRLIDELANLLDDDSEGPSDTA